MQQQKKIIANNLNCNARLARSTFDINGSLAYKFAIGHMVETFGLV